MITVIIDLGGTIQVCLLFPHMHSIHNLYKDTLYHLPTSFPCLICLCMSFSVCLFLLTPFSMICLQINIIEHVFVIIAIVCYQPNQPTLYHPYLKAAKEQADNFSPHSPFSYRLQHI